MHLGPYLLQSIVQSRYVTHVFFITHLLTQLLHDHQKQTIYFKIHHLENGVGVGGSCAVSYLAVTTSSNPSPHQAMICNVSLQVLGLSQTFRD